MGGGGGSVCVVLVLRSVLHHAGSVLGAGCSM